MPALRRRLRGAGARDCVLRRLGDDRVPRGYGIDIHGYDAVTWPNGAFAHWSTVARRAHRPGLPAAPRTTGGCRNSPGHRPRPRDERLRGAAGLRPWPPHPCPRRVESSSPTIPGAPRPRMFEVICPGRACRSWTLYARGPRQPVVFGPPPSTARSRRGLLARRASACILLSAELSNPRSENPRAHQTHRSLRHQPPAFGRPRPAGSRRRQQSDAAVRCPARAHASPGKHVGPRSVLLIARACAHGASGATRRAHRSSPHSRAGSVESCLHALGRATAGATTHSGVAACVFPGRDAAAASDLASAGRHCVGVRGA